MQLNPLVESNVHAWTGSASRRNSGAEHPSLFIRQTDVLLPQYVLRSAYRGDQRTRSIIVTGVGQHQMWAASALRILCKEPN